MPEKITKDDGTEIEVLTSEEQTALQEKATLADTLQATVDTLTAEKTKLEEANPEVKNWKKLREVNDNLKAAMTAQGKIVSEDGVVSEAPKTLTAEEVAAQATSAANNVLLTDRRRQAFAELTEEEKPVAELYYKKLTTGEEVTSENVEKLIADAKRMAVPPVDKVGTSIAGAPPILKDPNKQSFDETEKGQDIANEIFGDNSFAKKEVKK